MGVGKTSVGRCLAERLGWEFVDTDVLIEQRRAMPITEIFARHGETVFRQTEHEVLAETAEMESVVVATGGGALLSDENRALFASDSLVVCLTARPEDIVARLSDNQTRPLLATEDRLTRIQTLLADRQAQYDKIPVQIDTTGRSIDEIATELERYIH
jgi:shikimate kinase